MPPALLASVTIEQFDVLSALMDEALDLPSGLRDDWLERLPADHAALKPILRKLLSHADDEGFLSTLPRIAGDEPQDQPGIHAGAVISGYRLIREIGHGGMSSVWLAERCDRLIKRKVALKLPFVTSHRPEFIERFARERDILAALTHPHIARLYDAGVTPLGQPFLAMEYVEGVPLLQHCDGRGMGVDARLRLFLQILQAVQYAHAQLVIHRDLKPSNILVTADHRVSLLDFGIAKLLVDGEANETELTQWGGRPLTLSYAAPEQITGRPLSTAADVYSLGVVLFELLAGVPPYKAAGESRGALEEAILHTDPPKPSQCLGDSDCASTRGTTIAKLAQALRGDLDTIVLKALRKAPEERYVTAEAFAADVDRHLNQQPVLARPDRRWYVVQKFIRRHRIPVGIGMAAFSAVMIAAGIALFEAHEATVERDRALRISGRNAAVTDFLKTITTEAAQSRTPITVNEMLARSEQLAAEEFRDEPDNRAELFAMLGEYYFTSEQLDHARALFDKARDLTRYSSDWDLQGRLICYSAQFGAGEPAVSMAMATMRKVIDDPRTSDRLAAQCLSPLTDYAAESGRREDALRYSLEALSRIERVEHPPVDEYSTVLSEVARAQGRLGRNDLANAYFERAMRLLGAAGRDRSAIAKTIRGNWASILMRSGNQRRALELLNESLSIVQSAGGDAPADFVLLAKRAQALYNVGRFDESMANSRSCIDHVSPGALPWLITCQTQLVVTNADLGDLETARRYLHDAIATAESDTARADSVRPRLQLARARMAMADRRHAEALEVLNSVVAADGRDNRALRLRAELYLEMGDLVHAEIDARSAITLGEQLQGGAASSDQTGLSWLLLGRIMAKQGRPGGAHEALNSAIRHLSDTVDATHPALRQAQALSAAVGIS